MTRASITIPVFQWECDVCRARTGPVARTCEELPDYAAMIAAGWSIAKSFGDACPACVAAGKTPDTPRHSLMAATR